MTNLFILIGIGYIVSMVTSKVTNFKALNIFVRMLIISIIGTSIRIFMEYNEVSLIITTRSIIINLLAIPIAVAIFYPMMLKQKKV